MGFVKPAVDQLSLLLRSVFREAAHESSLGNWSFMLKGNESFIVILERENNSCKEFVMHRLRGYSRRTRSCAATSVNSAQCSLVDAVLQRIFSEQSHNSHREQG